MVLLRKSLVTGFVGVLGVVFAFSLKAEAILDIDTDIDNVSTTLPARVSGNGAVVVGRYRKGGQYFNAFKYTGELGIVDLGTLGGSGSVANDVSRDGGVIVGEATNAANVLHAFKYTDSAGMIDLGTLVGFDRSRAARVSADGSTIIGTASSAANHYGQAFKYTDGAGMVGLGTLGGRHSSADDISDDGSVIVGSSSIAGGDFHAFKYTDNSGMVDLGTFGGSTSKASSVSANGQVITGFSRLASGADHAFKYTDGGGMVSLGTLGGRTSVGQAVSANGSVIVGYSELADGSRHAFKHSDATGMVDLGTLGGRDSAVSAVSADGLVMIGDSQITGGRMLHAFKYTDSGGMVDLGTLGGSFSSVTDLSDDGAVIVGQSTTATGENHTFIVKDVRMVDLDNSYVAMEQNGHQLNSILNLQATLLSSALDHDCRVYGENNVCVAVGSEYSRVNNKNSSLTGLGLTLGYLLTPEVRVGLFMDQSLDSNLPDNYRIKSSMPMFGGFAAWNSRPDGLGAEVKGSVAYSKLDTEITRLTLDNTEAGKGRSKVKGLGLQLETSYGVALGERWKVQPFIGLKRVDSQRDGYREHTGADFAMSYRAVENNVTSLYVGSGLRGTLTKDLVLSTRFGLEQDISRSTSDYRSRADYLGGMRVKASAPQRVRGFASLGAEYSLGHARYISVNGDVAQQSLGQELGYSVMASYTFGY
ncbi:autotransporter domain-containing protein [Pseudomonas protegens]|uniref:autotransporter domain-containing protein n=1 Tax=Pseudomonas protegens TaxID=380021 RepID=UPI0021C593E1|nr:autotransporter domain-containing protein [Pseudomonas protegens]MCU1765530.1 autotransporter domain-containing protein [Pseudomonas protegens]